MVMAELILVIGWIAGIVLSKGFWFGALAFVVPPYAWYLVVEKIMRINGWL